MRRRSSRSRNQLPVGAMQHTPSELRELERAYARNYLRWAPEAADLVTLSSPLDPVAPLVSKALETSTARPSRRPVTRAMASPRLSTLHRRFRALRASAPQPVELPEGPARRNLIALGDQLGLSVIERQVLQLAMAFDCSNDLRDLVCSRMVSRVEDVVTLVAATAGLRAEDVRSATQRTSVLVRSGLVRFEQLHMISVDPRVSSLVLDTHLEPGDVLNRFLRLEPACTLDLADYAPVRPALEAAMRVLEGWKRTRAPGVNLLLHGATGVGKTEAARLLAREAGLGLYLASGEGKEGGSPTPEQRLASLGTGNLLLARSTSALLFDELEDIIASPLRAMPLEDGALSKLWINRLFETNEVPTVWTTNSLDFVDPALLRRFSLAIEFPALTLGQRRKTWERHAGGALPADELDTLAQAHEVSPGDISSAVRTAKLAGDTQLDRATLDLALEGAQRARGLKVRPATRAGSSYRLDALNANRDLVALSDQLARWRPGTSAGLTLCLYGRSGTGKSEYVHHLARRLDRPLHVRRVSDLQSKWVGETERNLAAAFAGAEREGAVLLLDEADTFLHDRRGAQYSWERSQANEFLQQLEACRGFVAVTTNLYEHLDPAVLRRFLFKVEFLPLRREQCGLLWDAHLAPLLAAPLDARARAQLEVTLGHVGELVAGDFGVVARRVGALGGNLEAAALLRELEEEVSARRHLASRPVGFRGVVSDGRTPSAPG